MSANYRLIDIDALDSEAQFPPELLNPPLPPVDILEIQGHASQCRQLLQRGDQGGALRIALENVPYGGDEAGKVCHQCPSLLTIIIVYFISPPFPSPDLPPPPL